MAHDKCIIIIIILLLLLHFELLVCNTELPYILSERCESLVIIAVNSVEGGTCIKG